MFVSYAVYFVSSLSPLEDFMFTPLRSCVKSLELTPCGLFFMLLSDQILIDRTVASVTSIKSEVPLRGIVQPKIKIQSLSTHPRASERPGFVF